MALASQRCYELFIGLLYQEVTVGTIHPASVLSLVLKDKTIAESIKSVRFLDSPPEDYSKNSKYLKRYDGEVQARVAEECVKLCPSLLSPQQDDDIPTSRSITEIKKRNVTDQLRHAIALSIDNLPNLMQLEATSGTALPFAKLNSLRGGTILLKGRISRLSSITLLSNLTLKNAAFLMVYLKNLQSVVFRINLDVAGLMYADGLKELRLEGKSNVKKLELQMVFAPGYVVKTGHPLHQDVSNPIVFLTHKLVEVKAYYPFVDSGTVPQLFSFSAALSAFSDTLTHLFVVTRGAGIPFFFLPPKIKCFAASGDYWRDIGNLKDSKGLFMGDREVLPELCDE